MYYIIYIKNILYKKIMIKMKDKLYKYFIKKIYIKNI